MEETSDIKWIGYILLLLFFFSILFALDQLGMKTPGGHGENGDHSEQVDSHGEEGGH